MHLLTFGSHVGIAETPFNTLTDRWQQRRCSMFPIKKLRTASLTSRPVLPVLHPSPTCAALKRKAPPPSSIISSATDPNSPHTPKEWSSFCVADNFLRLSQTLPSGQTFRWHRTGEYPHACAASGVAEEWIGTIGPHAFVLRQEVPRPETGPDPVWFRILSNDSLSTDGTASEGVDGVVDSEENANKGEDEDEDEDEDEGGDVRDEDDEMASGLTTELDSVEIKRKGKYNEEDVKKGTGADEDAVTVLRDYFRADTDFSDAYRQFIDADPVFARTFPHFSGMRTLRQPPEECLFAFICSSNNNIKRISTMVTSLAVEYGTLLAEYVSESGEAYQLHSFPSAEVLAKACDEKELRSAGFGYRAKFITSAAKGLELTARRATHGRADYSKNSMTVAEMLLSWREEDRVSVIKKLSLFTGIGRKVAACIALMSLDQLGEIPVDTHVWKIAQRYRPELAKTKSLTLRVHEDVGAWFRERFGSDLAGVAHNFLFVGELADFKKSLPEGTDIWGGAEAGGDDKGEDKKVGRVAEEVKDTKDKQKIKVKKAAIKKDRRKTKAGKGAAKGMKRIDPL